MTLESLSSDTTLRTATEPEVRSRVADDASGLGPYTVKARDTLSTIARDHKVTLQAMRDANPQIVNPDTIFVGQQLDLPAGAVSPAEAFVSPSGPTPTLERRDRGPVVTELQQGLAKAGFDPGPVDGIFGARTETAVREFQASRALEVDGIVGKQTWGALGRTAADAVPVTGDVQPTGDAATDRRIQGLHPEVRAVASQFINRVESELGIQLRVTDGFRSFADQNALYAQGRNGNPGSIVTYARGGQSYHNYGLAFDVAELRPNGQVSWDTDWEAIGRIGESMGLEWGGRWTRPVDRPHFQLDFGHSTGQLLQRVNEGNVGAGNFVNVH